MPTEFAGGVKNLSSKAADPYRTIVLSAASKVKAIINGKTGRKFEQPFLGGGAFCSPAARPRRAGACAAPGRTCDAMPPGADRGKTAIFKFPSGHPASSRR